VGAAKKSGIKWINRVVRGSKDGKEKSWFCERQKVMRLKKHRFLRVELGVLIFVVCIWVVKSATIDIDSVKAGVLKQVVKVDRDNVEAYAAYYDRSHDFEKAAKFANQLVRIEPNEPKTWNDLGDEYANCGRYEEAIMAYNKAAQLDPNWPWPHICLAFTYKDLHRYNEAIEEVEQVIKLEPDVVGLKVVLADFYSQAGQYEKAVAALKQVVDAEPDSSQAYYKLGEVYLKMGNKNLALEQYKTLKSLDEDLASQLFELIYR